jgi:hypothetical protein
MASVLSSQPTPPLDWKTRLGGLGGTALTKLLRGHYEDDTEFSAVQTVFQISPPLSAEAQAFCDAGHKFQPKGAEFYIEERKKAGQTIRLVDGTSIRDPALPWFICTPDYFIEDNTALGGVAEVKFWAGKRRDHPVNLMTHGKVREKRCPHAYINQVMQQMKCSQKPYAAVIIGSDVNIDYAHVKYDEKWWPTVSRQVNKFYETYLRWFWECEDPTPELRAVFEKSKENRPPEVCARIDDLIRTHAPPEHVRFMQQLRKRSNQ